PPTLVFLPYTPLFRAVRPLVWVKFALDLTRHMDDIPGRGVGPMTPLAPRAFVPWGERRAWTLGSVRDTRFSPTCSRADRCTSQRDRKSTSELQSLAYL